MRPLRYSINVTLDGCCDHREGIADEELHRHAAEAIARADALLFGRVIYQMMEDAWRAPARTGVVPDWMEPWMLPFAKTIDAAKKYVVSRTLDRVDWNAEPIDRLRALSEVETAPARRFGDRRSTTEAGTGQRAVSGRSKARAVPCRIGTDRRIRVHRASTAGRTRADVVRGAFNACRPQASEPAGIQVRRGSNAV
jgi:hypothetical protein